MGPNKINQNWFGKGAGRPIIWTNIGIIHWRISPSLGELIENDLHPLYEAIIMVDTKITI